MIDSPERALRRKFFLMKRSTRRLKRIALTLLLLDVVGFAGLRLLRDYEQFIF